MGINSHRRTPFKLQPHCLKEWMSCIHKTAAPTRETAFRQLLFYDGKIGKPPLKIELPMRPLGSK